MARRKKPPRKSLNVDTRIAKRIKNLSEELGVPQSQIYEYFAVRGLLEDFENSDLFNRLENSDSLRWKKNINLDDLLSQLDD